MSDFALAGPIASSRGLSREFAKYLTCLSNDEADECYHLAAQSFVTYSFEDEFSMLNANINGTHHVLSDYETVLRPAVLFLPRVKCGKVAEVPQTDPAPFHLRFAYGI